MNTTIANQVIMEINKILTRLFERLAGYREERPSAGTVYRLMGLAADILEVAETLQREVLDVVSHEAVLDADVDTDYAALSVKVLGMELEDKADADDDIREKTRIANDALGELSNMLSQIDGQLKRHHKDEEYERLYENEKRRYMSSGSSGRARQKVEEWKDMEGGRLQQEQIADYIVEKLLHMFEKNALAAGVEHVLRVKRFPGEVDFEQVEISQKITKTVYHHYTALRRIVDYNDGCLVVDPVRVGKYFYLNRHEENAKAHRSAFLNYMHKIELAQGEMRRLQEEMRRLEEEAARLQAETARRQKKGSRRLIQNVEELNYFAPTKNLQELLRQPWFKALRTNERYNQQWTDGFVSALMASEYKDGIAQDWAIQGKRRKVTQIKGYIVGLLSDAGVLKGSYDSIAAKIGLTTDPRSFSRYMSQGKKQPFAEWVSDYVSEELNE